MEELKIQDFEKEAEIKQIIDKYNNLKQDVFSEAKKYENRHKRMDLNKIFKEFENIFLLQWKDCHICLKKYTQVPLNLKIYADVDKPDLSFVYSDFFYFASFHFG